jgi:hypothetical protein
MYVTFNLEHGNEKMTNFRIAEAVINLCDDTHESCECLNAEIVAKMILLQKGGANNAQ